MIFWPIQRLWLHRLRLFVVVPCAKFIWIRGGMIHAAALAHMCMHHRRNGPIATDFLITLSLPGPTAERQISKMVLSFPTQPCSVIIGTILDQFSNLFLKLPFFNRLYQQAQLSTRPSGTLDVKGYRFAGLATSLARSYAINSLLALTGARRISSAAVVGTLVYLASSGPQLISNAFIAKQPLSSILAQTVVKLSETVVLAAALTAVKESHGSVNIEW